MGVTGTPFECVIVVAGSISHDAKSVAVCIAEPFALRMPLVQPVSLSP